MSHAYVAHLGKDRRIKKLIEQHGTFTLKKSNNLYIYLCNSIMSQQLSTKVATVIRNRFLSLYGNRIPTPDQIIATPPETLRAIGLSNAKTSYVQNVARFALEQGMDARKLHKMDNEEVIQYLTQIKGVGRWTVEMLLIFAMAREDVFAPDDLGIQNAMIGLYKLDRSDKKIFREKMLTLAQKWSPFRTYACLHLWRWKDNAPVTAKT
jgi:DNA-3-methyladenine glycosylase II